MGIELKKVFISILSLFLVNTGIAQEVKDLVIRVIDVETKRPIENVDIFVQETGSVGITAKFGLSKFSRVPTGKIVIELSKDGYIYKKQEINITNQEYENVITLELTAAKANHISIWGGVKYNGKSLADIEVIVRSARFVRKIITDKYGYFSIYIPKDSITSTLLLSIKDPRYKELELKIQILQNEADKEVPINLESGVTGLSAEMSLAECMDNEYYYGQVRFTNEFKENLILYSQAGYEDNATYRGYDWKPTSGLVVPAGGETVSSKLKIRIKACANCPEGHRWSAEYRFYFMTENTQGRKYGVIVVDVDKCMIKHVIISSKKLFLQSEILY